MAKDATDRVAVDVDEPGHHGEARDVQSRVGASPGEVTDGRYSTGANADVDGLARPPAPVEHLATGEDHVKRLGASRGQEQERRGRRRAANPSKQHNAPPLGSGQKLGPAPKPRPNAAIN